MAESTVILGYRSKNLKSYRMVSRRILNNYEPGARFFIRLKKYLNKEVLLSVWAMRVALPLIWRVINRLWNLLVRRFLLPGTAWGRKYLLDLMWLPILFMMLQKIGTCSSRKAFHSHVKVLSTCTESGYRSILLFRLKMDYTKRIGLVGQL